MSWIWPAQSQNRSEIGAILRFDQHRFSTLMGIRSQFIDSFWCSSNYVEVPLPNQIGTLINMDYTTDSGRILNDRNFLAPESTNFIGAVIPGTLYGGAGTDMNRRSPGGFKNNLQGVGVRTTSAADDPRMAFLDVIDTTWLGQSRRKYNFTINLTCKSMNDSFRAASICNFMSGQCLPYLTLFNADDIVANQRAFHPPMWAIHVEGNDGNRHQSTRMWLGEYPQLCVLQQVSAIRVGGDGNQVIGMIDPDGEFFVPIVYQLNLSFLELEPVYRNSNGSSMAQSRSQFFIT